MGIYVVSARSFKCTFESARAKFHKGFNAIFGKKRESCTKQTFTVLIMIMIMIHWQAPARWRAASRRAVGRRVVAARHPTARALASPRRSSHAVTARCSGAPTRVPPAVGRSASGSARCRRPPRHCHWPRSAPTTTSSTRLCWRKPPPRRLTSTESDPGFESRFPD